MTSSNRMVIGLQIGKLHRKGESAPPPPPTVPDSENPGLFRVKLTKLATFMLKILEKLKRKDDFKIVAIVAKCKFDTVQYDSFVQ